MAEEQQQSEQQTVEEGGSLIDQIMQETRLKPVDEGYETAILDANSAYPVERYKDKEDALIGHYEWCKKAESLEK